MCLCEQVRKPGQAGQNGLGWPHYGRCLVATQATPVLQRAMPHGRQRRSANCTPPPSGAARHTRPMHACKVQHSSPTSRLAHLAASSWEWLPSCARTASSSCNEAGSRRGTCLVASRELGSARSCRQPVRLQPASHTTQPPCRLAPSQWQHGQSRQACFAEGRDLSCSPNSHATCLRQLGGRAVHLAQLLQADLASL